MTAAVVPVKALSSSKSRLALRGGGLEVFLQEHAAIGFDDDGRTFLANIGNGGFHFGKRTVVRRRDAVAGHEILAKGF